MAEDPDAAPRTPGWGYRLAVWMAGAFVLLWLLLAAGLAINGQWQRAVAGVALAGAWAAIFLVSHLRRRRRRR